MLTEYELGYLRGAYFAQKLDPADFYGVEDYMGPSCAKHILSTIKDAYMQGSYIAEVQDRVKGGIEYPLVLAPKRGHCYSLGINAALERAWQYHEKRLT